MFLFDSAVKWTHWPRLNSAMLTLLLKSEGCVYVTEAFQAISEWVCVPSAVCSTKSRITHSLLCVTGTFSISFLFSPFSRLLSFSLISSCLLFSPLPFSWRQMWMSARLGGTVHSTWLLVKAHLHFVPCLLLQVKHVVLLITSVVLGTLTVWQLTLSDTLRQSDKSWHLFYLTKKFDAKGTHMVIFFWKTSAIMTVSDWKGAVPLPPLDK